MEQYVVTFVFYSPIKLPPELEASRASIEQYVYQYRDALPENYVYVLLIEADETRLDIRLLQAKTRGYVPR